MEYRVIAEPTVEPISIEDCRQHLRVDTDLDSNGDGPDDTLILNKLADAREWAEKFTGLWIGKQTLELPLDAFPSNEIKIEWGPVQSMVSVTYVDADGAEQVVPTENYVLDNYRKPAWLLLAAGAAWPATYDTVNAVKIRFVAGYSLADDDPRPFPLPRSIRTGLLLLLGHLYENREDSTEKALTTIPNGVESFLRPLRVRLGMA